MITEATLVAIIIALTIIVVADLIRRYYQTKFEFEYKTHRLKHDETVLATDGGESDE